MAQLRAAARDAAEKAKAESRQAAATGSEKRAGEAGESEERRAGEVREGNDLLSTLVGLSPACAARVGDGSWSSGSALRGQPLACIEEEAAWEQPEVIGDAGQGEREES